MKNILFLFTFILAVQTMAQSAEHERLKSLLKKEVESMQKGSGPLGALEENEKVNLTNKLGAFETHRLLNEVVLATSKSPQLKKINDFSEQIVNSTPPKNLVEKAPENPVKPTSVKDVVATDSDSDEEEEDLETKPSVKSATMDRPNYSEEEKEKMLKKVEKLPVKTSATTTNVGRDVAAKFVATKSKLYDGVPRNGIDKAEFGTELTRGSMSIVRDSIGINDEYTIHTCIDAGVAIYFESKQMTVADIWLSDQIYFSAEKRTESLVMLRQIQSVKKNMFREADLLVFRSKDMKPYLIKIVGNPCPAGTINYPRAVYLSDREDKATELKTKLLPAEDMTVSLTKGFKRVNAAEVNVYDFLSDSASDRAMVAVEIASEKPLKDLEFRISNNKGNQEVELNPASDVVYLKASSEIKSRQEKKYVYRFLLYPKVQKSYIVHNRHINLFIIDSKSSEYQHVQIDLLPLYNSQRTGG